MIDISNIVPMPIGMRLIAENSDYWASWWQGAAWKYANIAETQRRAVRNNARYLETPEHKQEILVRAFRNDLIADACLANAIGWASR